MSVQIGGIGNSLGDLTESMFSGTLWEKFAQYGIPVSTQSERKKFSDGKRIIAEADIFIENGEYAIPVEINWTEGLFFCPTEIAAWCDSLTPDIV